MKPAIYKSEADLCKAFIGWASNQGWVAYPETCEFDILLVKNQMQFGIQAKMRFNATLLRQILPSRGYRDEDIIGPNYRAILLNDNGRKNWDIQDVCNCIGLDYFSPNQCGGFYPEIGAAGTEWYRTGPCPLPGYIPDVAAGVQCPVQLTDWKVKALKITAILELRGYVCANDFKHFNIDYRRWATPISGWLRLENGKLVRGNRLRFDKQHPVVYQQIREEIRELLLKNDPEFMITKRRSK